MTPPNVNNEHYPDDDAERLARAVRDWIVTKLEEATFIEVSTFFTSLLGLIVTVIVAWIYYGQLVQMRDATSLTRKTLDLNTKTLLATQAAGFDCEGVFDVAGTRFFIQCTNKGEMSATNIGGVVTFVRIENGVIAQKVERHVSRQSILKGNNLGVIFPITNMPPVYDMKWMSEQKMKGTISFTYNNGIEETSISGCWASFIAKNSFGFTDCDNARAINDPKGNY